MNAKSCFLRYCKQQLEDASIDEARDQLAGPVFLV